MATTRKVSEALDFVAAMVKRMPFNDQVGLVCVRDVLNRMWYAAPWRWTVGNFPRTTVSAATTDYTITLPSDFEYIVELNVWNGKQSMPLQIVGSLPTVIDESAAPTMAALIDGGSTLRIAPKPSATLPTTHTITGLYKKTAPAVTSKKIFDTAGLLGMPDQYFQVFCDGLLWRGYEYADDQRAGEAVTKNDGLTQYTGQLGLFMAGLDDMRRREKLPLERQVPGVPKTQG